MSVPEYPGKKASMRRWLAAATAETTSPFTLTSQVQDWGGRRWEYEVQVATSQDGNGRALSAFFNGLGGPAGRFILRDAAARAPAGLGSPEVSGAGQSGASLAVSGLNVIGARNRLHNSRMRGAAVGLLSAGGAPPAGWTFSGLAAPDIEVVSITPEDGRPTIRVRFNGTPTAGVFLNFAGLSDIAAVNTQVWTGSAWLQVVGGGLTNITNVNLRVTSIGGGNSQTDWTATSADLVRRIHTRTMNAGTTHTRHSLFINATVGSPIDVTIKIQAPQLELAAAATEFEATPVDRLRAGDLFSLGAGADLRLYEIRSDVQTQPDGTAALPISPPLRGSPPNAAPLDFATPGCVVRLAGPVPADIAPADIYRFAFQAREAL